MKHIKRKFLNVHPKTPRNSWDQLDFEKITDLYKPGVIPADKVFGMKLEDGTFVATFRYEKSREDFYFIPEPEPILMYFNNAQIHLALVAKAKEELLTECKKLKNGIEMGHKLYAFMYSSSSVCIFLFTAIEATLNKLIPEDFTYTDKKGNIKGLEEIQWLSFEDKIKKVLPKATGKDFVKAHHNKYGSLLKIKNYRDSIIHTKKKAEITSYSDIGNIGLDLNYNFLILEVRDFINFYYPRLVEPCDCGKDF